MSQVMTVKQINTAVEAMAIEFCQAANMIATENRFGLVIETSDMDTLDIISNQWFNDKEFHLVNTTTTNKFLLVDTDKINTKKFLKAIAPAVAA